MWFLDIFFTKTRERRVAAKSVSSPNSKNAPFSKKTQLAGTRNPFCFLETRPEHDVYGMNGIGVVAQELEVVVERKR